MDTTNWILEFMGRLHPLMVHFPIGLLMGAFLLEAWAKWKKQKTDYKALIYLGAITAVGSAVMGGLLKTNEEYSGALVDQHQNMGYLTAALAVVSAVIYGKKEQFPPDAPFLSLGVCCFALIIAGHLGASLTHGPHYLTEVLPWNEHAAGKYGGEAYGEGTNEEIQHFLTAAQQDSFPQDQLDKLNLQVRAIFAHNCYQCHSTAKRKGGLALDHKEGVFEGGDSGKVIQVGQAEESEMIRRLLLPRSEEEAMPPKGKSLKPQEIELLKLWINKGAHWAEGELKIFREAELALEKPKIPVIETEMNLTNPIDQFVHVYFQQKGIDWPEIANDRQFIRRAYLDIIGLLPTPEQVAQFLNSPAPHKRAKLIDELLAQEEDYTLHWLSFWNDLLRNDYSGTGFITGGRKQISNWLYQSLLANKPYDQLVKELVNPMPESEGFIKGIQWRGVVNASQRTELQAAQNISQSLLGLNLKCASCHNSFVNNLTLDQAYGFANIFAEEPLEIYRCDKPTGRMAQTAFLYPELGEVKADSIKARLAELAHIMIQAENGRLYRTWVNRVWKQLMGRGIVAPVDEMDNIPWSQDLLDWLAADFIENGYNVRQLLAQIMTSQTYQLAAHKYSSPAYMASEQFVFQGPSIRRLTAEQFVDAFSQVITPLYYGVGFDPNQREVDALWIWHEERKLDRTVLPEPGKRWFRKAFSLRHSQPLIAAELIITADHAYRLHLNEREILKGTDWRSVESLDIPIDLFQPTNIIAIEGENEGDIPNPAGLLLSLKLAYEDSSVQFIHSDRSWKTTDQLINGEVKERASTKRTEDISVEVEGEMGQWRTLAFQDTGWKKAWKAGSFEKSYWGGLLEFTFERDSIRMPFVRAALVRQDEFMKALGRPVRENVTTQRNQESTLLQSLLLTNSHFFHEAIERGAKEYLDQWGDQVETLIEQLYLSALGRQPSKKERTILRKALTDKTYEQKWAALQDIIWTLVLLPEFQLI